MYGSIPGNAVILNFLMRWPILAPIVVATGIAVAVPESAPVSEPTPVLVPLVQETKCVVLFDTDKYSIQPIEHEKLQTCLKTVNRNLVTKISVDGHTDNRHNAQYNLVLSKRRAEAVKEILVKMEFEPKQINLTFHGKGKPFANNDTPNGRQLNRRVEVVVQ